MQLNLLNRQRRNKMQMNWQQFYVLVLAFVISIVAVIIRYLLK